MTRSARAIWMVRRHAPCPPWPAARVIGVARIVGCALLVTLAASPVVLRADEPPARPAAPSAKPPEVDADAVTVEAVPGQRLVDAYRTSPYVAFVTPDAALAAYGILRRDLEDALARHRDEQFVQSLRTFELTRRIVSIVHGVAGQPPRYGGSVPTGPPPAPSRAEIRLASLRAMYGVGTTNARLAPGVAQALARLRGELPFQGGSAVGLDVDPARDPDPYASATEAWESDPSGRAARWRVVAGQVFPAGPTFGDSLEEPYPGSPLTSLTSRLTLAIASEMAFSPLFAARQLDDLWFGTPADRLIPVWPAPVEVPKPTALAALAPVLAALPTPPPSAPRVIHGSAYRALLEHAAYGGDVLARAGPIQRRAGAAVPPAGLAAAGDRILVHPDPAFWRGLARVCQALADEAPRHGLAEPPPGDPSLAPPRPPPIPRSDRSPASRGSVPGSPPAPSSSSRAARSPRRTRCGRGGQPSSRRSGAAGAGIRSP